MMRCARAVCRLARSRMFVVTSLSRGAPHRWQSSLAEGGPAAAVGDNGSGVASSTASTMETATGTARRADSRAAGDAAADATMRYAAIERVAAARRDIFDLWRRIVAREEAGATGQGHSAAAVQGSEGTLTSNESSPPEAAATTDAERLAGVEKIMTDYRLDPSTPREEDISRGLGDALDRLLLLCLPLVHPSGTAALEKLLLVAGRQVRQWSMRTVQHLFARTGSFAEALALFHAMRKCHFAMNMETYHAMLYSLQRLEEEGWGQRFHEEYTTHGLSEQALDFVLRGVDNQLLPENKPWLGRIMFAEPSAESAVTQQHQARKSYDDMGKLWMQRYRGEAGAHASNGSDMPDR